MEIQIYDLIFNLKINHFSHPIVSRFINDEALRNQTSFKKEKKEFKINPKKIKNGYDQRTSMIIKGLPSIMDNRDLYSLISLYTSNFDFLHIPKSAKETKQFMYAFVNLTSPKALLSLYLGLISIKEKYKYYKGFNLSNLELLNLNYKL